MQVVAGPTNGPLADAVANRLDAGRVDAKTKLFPDGEAYVRLLAELPPEDVAVVATPIDNDHLVMLLLMLDAVKAHGAGRVVAVLPYYAYARQDQRFQPGEALSAQVVAKAVGLYADALVTVDPHKEYVLDYFPGSATGPSAVPELARTFADKGVDLVLAPDAGARGRAQAAAELMDVRFDHLEKKRLSGDTVEMTPKDLDVDGKTVAIVDDIIATGGTMATASGQLKAQGARAVYCAATHGLFTGGAVERLENAGVDEVIATDTIPGPRATVSAAPAIVRGLVEVLGLEHKAIS